MRELDLYINVCRNVIGYNRIFKSMSNKNRREWFGLICKLLDEARFYNINDIKTEYENLCDIFYERRDNIFNIKGAMVC